MRTSVDKEINSVSLVYVLYFRSRVPGKVITLPNITTLNNTLRKSTKSVFRYHL